MDDVEYLPLSWLSQICYCPRRAGLLLNERLWSESSDTAKGRAEHERVHTQRVERRGDLIKLYEYTVCSDAMQITGKCDCIEATRDASGCQIPGVEFPVQLFPIEYKHGTVRDEPEYKIQLCAQALCLEEMFGACIREGALFFISSHRRLTIPLDDSLRIQTRALAGALHRIRKDLAVPGAVYSSKCTRCSLKELCMPKVKPSAKSYCERLRKESAAPFDAEELP